MEGKRYEREEFLSYSAMKAWVDAVLEELVVNGEWDFHSCSMEHHYNLGLSKRVYVAEVTLTKEG